MISPRFLEAAREEWLVDEVGDQGIGGNEDVSSRHENVHQARGQAVEERPQVVAIVVGEHGKSRER